MLYSVMFDLEGDLTYVSGIENNLRDQRLELIEIVSHRIRFSYYALAMISSALEEISVTAAGLCLGSNLKRS